MDKPELISLPLYVDDRGTVHCPMDELHNKGIKRTYIVKNWSGARIRAWHGHEKADTYMHVIEGAVKIAAKPISSKNPPGVMIGLVGHIDETKYMVKTLMAEKPEIIKIPAGWFNGAMSLTEGTKILVYSTLSFNEVKDDDIRDFVSETELLKVFRVVNR